LLSFPTEQGYFIINNIKSNTFISAPPYYFLTN
jgi:hypothetical protein